MKRITFLGYGVLAHLMFLATYAYMAAFTGDLHSLAPRTIDAVGAPFAWGAMAVNALLIVAFGLQHSVMARPAFKEWWTKWVPSEIERSTYVVISNVFMIGLMFFWQPVGPNVWHVESTAGRTVLWVGFAAGWLMVPLVSLLINHFDLFGTRQVWLAFKGRRYQPLPFGTPGIYRIIRHPLYVGWMLAFWATPTMSVGHLLFAGLMSAYMLIAIPFEERDLVDAYGDQYRVYREGVPGLVPRPRAARDGRQGASA